MTDTSSAAVSRDEYDSHSPIEEREWSAGNPPLGHDDPVLPNPHRDEGEAMSTVPTEDPSEVEPEVPETEDDEPETEEAEDE